MICKRDGQGVRVVYVNAAFERLTGYSADEMYGQPYDAQLLKSCAMSAQDPIREAIRTGRALIAAFRLTHKSGTELRVELTAGPASDHFGMIRYCVIALRDLKQTSHHVEHLSFIANHDSLTGLPNRRLLLDRIDQALARHHRRSDTFSVAFLDLNELKCVNDRFGHAAGDELLRYVSRCLAAGIRSCDTVARYGGDEFVLLLTSASDADTASATVARAVRCLDQDCTINGSIFKPTCSVGIAVCPRDGTDAATLLHAADQAMYRAKSTDRSMSLIREF